MLRLDWNLAFTVINLLILFLLMKKFLIGPVMGIIEKRKELIEEQLSNASKAEKTAMELKLQYENSIKDTDAQTNEMLEAARKKAAAEYDRIVKDADKKAEKMISEADKMIQSEREKMLREMQSEIAGLAMIAAAKVVNEKTDDNKNQSLYEDFLKKAGGCNDTNGN